MRVAGTRPTLRQLQSIARVVLTGLSELRQRVASDLL
jgi:hypothetical protein